MKRIACAVVFLCLFVGVILSGCMRSREEIEADKLQAEKYQARYDSYEEIMDNPVQYIEEFYSGGLSLTVRVDKTTYQYHDFVYVTVTLFNSTHETIDFWMPTQTRGVHQELPTVITNGEERLVDVDMELYEQTDNINYSTEPGLFTLEHNERYVQTMCFSPWVYSSHRGSKTGRYMKERPADGAYHGTVTAYVMKEEEIIPHTVEFDIFIEPDLGHMYQHW